MKKYHKINSIFKRDKQGNFTSEYSTPEFEYLKNNIWVFTEKINGTNIRVMWNEGKLRFGGKSDDAQMPVFLMEKLQEIFKQEKIDEIFGSDDVCLYGEGFGAKIQKGGGNYIRDGCDFILIDVKIGDWWLKREDIEDIANKLKVKIVKIIGEGTLQDAIDKAKEGFNSEFGEFTAEGIVLKPKSEMFARNGDRIITKIKYKDFRKVRNSEGEVKNE